MTEGWPEAFDGLARELRAKPGRPAFVDTSDVGADRLCERLTPLVGQVVSVGNRVTNASKPPTAHELIHDIGGSSTLLTDIDALFAAALHLDVVSQIRRLAQNTALFVMWPGRIIAGRLRYSLPGRADHLDSAARDTLVLRPLDTSFPDDIPYTLERYPA